MVLNFPVLWYTKNPRLVTGIGVESGGYLVEAGGWAGPVSPPNCNKLPTPMKEGVNMHNDPSLTELPEVWFHQICDRLDSEYIITLG